MPRSVAGHLAGHYDWPVQPFTVLVWNMARGYTSGHGKQEDSWDFMLTLLREHDVSIALLNEASCYMLKGANEAALAQGRPPPASYSEVGTVGRDLFIDKHGEARPKSRSSWSTAVFSQEGAVPLGEREVRPYFEDDTRIMPFKPSRPGTWMASSVTVNDVPIASVSLYGLMEEATDASMHTSLSEISPIFFDRNHGRNVVIGGDFNVSTAFASPPGNSVKRQERMRCRTVFDRLKAFDLVDCLAEYRARTGLNPIDGCTCADEPCRHSVTRLYPNKEGQDKDWRKRVSPQVDYLFASAHLTHHLDVTTLDPNKWEKYSDHAPLLISLGASD